MSKVKLKNNVWIEGFKPHEKSYMDDFITSFNHRKLPILYCGETSQIRNSIPELLIREYFDYGYDDLELHFTSVDMAIQESCQDKYCIIYKV